MAKILVVDDSTSMRKMVKFSLTTAGHSIIEATDGKAGLSAAKLDSFDLVLTDVNMPNMNGLELTQELRKLPNFKTTPILILTTESNDEKKKAGKAVGATGWIIKPFQPAKLISTVNKFT